MALDGSDRIDKTEFHHILLSQHDRVKPGLSDNVVDVRLKSKPYLWDPISTHGSGCGKVGVDSVSFTLDGPHRVHHAKAIDRICNQGVSM